MVLVAVEHQWLGGKMTLWLVVLLCLVVVLLGDADGCGMQHVMVLLVVVPLV